MAKLKICGITSIQDALAAKKAGADLIGLIVEIQRSASNIGRVQAKKIAYALHGKNIVALTELSKAEKIAGLCSFIGCNSVQLAGECNKRELLKLKKLLPKLAIMKTIPIKKGNIAKTLALIELVSGTVDFFVLDSATAKGTGGTGKTHDWKTSAEIVKKTKKPCFLAGGLNPENVEKAINAVKPFGVDASSSLKKNSNKRKLDIEKAKAFIAKSKQ